MFNARPRGLTPSGSYRFRRVHVDLHPPDEALNQETSSYHKEFLRWKLRRFAEVESEILFRLSANAARDGAMDIERFKERLRRHRGQITTVSASRTDPQTVIVLKGKRRRGGREVNRNMGIRIRSICAGPLDTGSEHDGEADMPGRVGYIWGGICNIYLGNADGIESFRLYAMVQLGGCYAAMQELWAAI